jgi:hypothetical protein
MAIGPRVTRRSSFSPAHRSFHWWTLNVLIAPSNARSGNGSFSATASIAGGRSAGRCARIDADGSTAVTARSAGS